MMEIVTSLNHVTFHHDVTIPVSIFYEINNSIFNLSYTKTGNVYEINPKSTQNGNKILVSLTWTG